MSTEENVVRLQRLVESFTKQNVSQMDKIKELEAEVERLQDELRQRDAEIAKLAEHSANRTYQVGELRDLIKERDAEIEFLELQAKLLPPLQELAEGQRAEVERLRKTLSKITDHLETEWMPPQHDHTDWADDYPETHALIMLAREALEE